jgi:hypothetical protein
MRKLNRQFSEENIQITNKYMKKCSTFSTIREMHIKMTLRFHLTPVRMTIIKQTNKQAAINAGEDAGGKGTLTLCWWQCK